MFVIANDALFTFACLIVLGLNGRYSSAEIV